MKIQIALFTIFMSFTSLFAQNSPATKDDIKMLIEQNRILREDMNKRFEMIQNQMDRRFEMMQHNMDKRFEQINKRFEDMQNMMFFGFSIIAAILSFLFIQNLIMIKSIGKLESKVDNISQILSFQETIPKTTLGKSLSKVQKAPERSFEPEIDLASLWKNSDKQAKQKIAKELKQLLEV